MALSQKWIAKQTPFRDYTERMWRNISIFRHKCATLMNELYSWIWRTFELYFLTYILKDTYADLFSPWIINSHTYAKWYMYHFKSKYICIVMKLSKYHSCLSQIALCTRESVVLNLLYLVCDPSLHHDTQKRPYYTISTQLKEFWILSRGNHVEQHALLTGVWDMYCLLHTYCLHRKNTFS